MCTARLFSQGVDLFALRFYLNRVIPINISWHQKTRDTGLPDAEDRIHRRDRQTDRQRDKRICHSIALAKLALRRAVKTNGNCSENAKGLN